MKKALALLLVLCLLLPLFSFAEKAPLYQATLRVASAIRTKGDKNASIIQFLKPRQKIEIYEVGLNWLLIGLNGKALGYIERKHIDDEKVITLNPKSSPPYNMVDSQAIIHIKNSSAVRAEPHEHAAALITLHKGAELAVIGFENGWAKLIFKRQYGYINSKDIGELIQLNKSMSENSLDVPIAAYTSFYNIASDKDNQNRIVNLQVSCQRFTNAVVQPGKSFDFNRDIGPYNARSGYMPAVVLVKGGTALGYGGGTCQTSSTLYNALLQLTGIDIYHRHAHGPAGAKYLPHGADAAVGTERQNLKFKNNYPFPIRIDGKVQDGAITVYVFRAE